MRGGGARRRLLSTASFYALAVVFMLPTVFVFYWMVTLSLKPQIEATAYPPSFVRFSITAAGSPANQSSGLTRRGPSG